MSYDTCPPAMKLQIISPVMDSSVGMSSWRPDNNIFYFRQTGTAGCAQFEMNEMIKPPDCLVVSSNLCCGKPR